MLIDYRIHNVLIDMRKWQSEKMPFTFRTRASKENLIWLLSFSLSLSPSLHFPPSSSLSLSYSFLFLYCFDRWEIIEIIIVLPQPIPYVPHVDKLALLMILRIGFLPRLIRDNHPLYKQRREIWKDARYNFILFFVLLF